MYSINAAQIEPYSLRGGATALEVVDPDRGFDEEIVATDHYEILRVSQRADEDTIERVYRTLANRFHPDNPSTGDAETFLRIREAYEILSDPGKRAQYNAIRQRNRGLVRFRLRGREFFDGVRGEQNRRLAALCLLYRQRIGSNDSPGLTVLDLEQLTGCTREELSSALWYLCEKKWALFGEYTEYTITAEGFDIVESKLEERLEFRTLATLCYYGSPREGASGRSTAPAEPRREAGNQPSTNLYQLANAVERLCERRVIEAVPAPEATFVAVPVEPQMKQAPADPPAPIAGIGPAVYEAASPGERSVSEGEPARPSRVTLGQVIVAAASVFICSRLVR